MNTRLEAFSDGVFAFALTLLIIDIRPPGVDTIHSAAALWLAVRAMGPAVFSFLMSFAVILIAWVYHHRVLKLVDKWSSPLLFANGLLLLSVVCLPFTTSLLGEFIATDAAGPAVAIYDGLLGVQALGWLAVTGAMLRGQLACNARAEAEIRENRNRSYGSVGLYASLALLGSWYPVTAALITAATWMFWLVLSVRAPNAD